MFSGERVGVRGYFLPPVLSLIALMHLRCPPHPGPLPRHGGEGIRQTSHEIITTDDSSLSKRAKGKET